MTAVAVGWRGKYHRYIKVRVKKGIGLRHFAQRQGQEQSSQPIDMLRRWKSDIPFLTIISTSIDAFHLIERFANCSGLLVVVYSTTNSRSIFDTFTNLIMPPIVYLLRMNKTRRNYSAHQLIMMTKLCLFCCYCQGASPSSVFPQ